MTITPAAVQGGVLQALYHRRHDLPQQGQGPCGRAAGSGKAGREAQGVLIHSVRQEREYPGYSLSQSGGWKNGLPILQKAYGRRADRGRKAAVMDSGRRGSKGRYPVGKKHK